MCTARPFWDHLQSPFVLPRQRPPGRRSPFPRPGSRPHSPSIDGMPVQGSSICHKFGLLTLTMAADITYQNTGHVIQNPFPNVSSDSSLVRTFPVFGKAIDVRWDGGKTWPAVTTQLNNDHLIKDFILKTRHHIHVRASPTCHCGIPRRMGAHLPQRTSGLPGTHRGLHTAHPITFAAWARLTRR